MTDFEVFQGALVERVADPGASTNKGKLYTKAVLGVTRLFYEASNGNITQITGGGGGGGGGGSQQYSGTDVSDTWLCPAGVFQVTIYAYPGAGGGGGGGSGGKPFDGSLNGRMGGAGGAGAGSGGGSCGLVPANLTVIPGTTYTRLIGAGGAGGVGGISPGGSGTAATNGSVTQFLDGATLLATWGFIQQSGTIVTGAQGASGGNASASSSTSFGGGPAGSGANPGAGYPTLSTNGSTGVGGAGGSQTATPSSNDGGTTTRLATTPFNVSELGTFIPAGATVLGGVGASLHGGGGAGGGGGPCGAPDSFTLPKWGFAAGTLPIPGLGGAGGAASSVAVGSAGANGTSATAASTGGCGGCGGGGGVGGGGGIPSATGGGAGGNGGNGGAGSGGRMIITWIGA